MKTIKIFLPIFMLTVFILSGCSPSHDIEKPASDVMLSIANVKPSTVSGAENIQLAFNLELLKSLSKEQNNIFYSSFSVNQALTMAYFGAKGQTQQEIKDTLGYNNLSTEDIAAYQKYLADVYKNPGDTIFYSANSLWIDDEISVKDDYINTMINSFDAEVATIDLQSDKAVDTLNKWIDKKTKSMITKLFEDPLSPMARLILMNAIYFKGQWTTPFNPELTYPVQFNGVNRSKETDMMFSDEDILGYEDDNYKSICLPYGDDERFAFIAVLPQNDILSYIENMTVESLSSILTTFDKKDEARILIPKFEMEEKLSLNDTLKSLGMETAFTDSADFSEITDSQLFISEVLHKAKIKVDEEGTEAAAVTAITFETTAMMPKDQFEFYADRPFIFFIVDTDNNTVLFSGIMFDVE